MLVFAVRNPRLLEKLKHRRLLGKFFALRVEELDSVSDPSLVDGAFSSFYVHRGNTSKETRRGRFSDLDDKTLSFLSRDRESLIHDVGVSSGVTSLDLLSALDRSQYRFKLFISDRFSRFYCSGRVLRRIYDRDHVLTRAYVFSILADGNLHWKHFVSKHLFSVLKLLPDNREDDREIVMYDPQVRKLIEQGRISEIDYDVLRSRLDVRFDFVRCMNLLNRSYFSEADIAKAVKNIKDSVREGGILQIGRTNSDNVNNVSFFRKVKNRFELVEDVNAGSEIKSAIILNEAKATSDGLGENALPGVTRGHRSDSHSVHRPQAAL